MNTIIRTITFSFLSVLLSCSEDNIKIDKKKIIHQETNIEIEQMYNNYSIDTIYTAVDFNNDGKLDQMLVYSNEAVYSTIALVKIEGQKWMTELILRGEPSIISKKEIQENLEPNGGDAILDMCDECVPSVLIWNGHGFSNKGLSW